MVSTQTAEFKQNLVRRYLLEKQKNPSLTIASFVENDFPDISKRNAYNWVRKYKSQEGKALNLTENEINGVYGTGANDMNLRAKFLMIMETRGFSEEQVGEYCRKHGIYKSDLDSWETECADALRDCLSPQERKHYKTIIKDQKQRITALEDEGGEMRRELNHKDKALATYAAKLTTMGNFCKLFTNSNEGD